MLRISRIFLKIATIVSTVTGAIILACSPVFLVLGFSSKIRDMVVTAINDGTINATSSAGLTTEQMVSVFQGSFIACGFVLIVLGIMCVVNAVLSSKTRSEPSKERYIACIVTGALSTDLSIPGAILGLIASKKEENNSQIEE